MVSCLRFNTNIYIYVDMGYSDYCTSPTEYVVKLITCVMQQASITVNILVDRTVGALIGALMGATIGTSLGATAMYKFVRKIYRVGWK